MLEKLLGLDIKLRQYEVGKRVLRRGRRGRRRSRRCNRVWRRPEQLPTLGRARRPGRLLAGHERAARRRLSAPRTHVRLLHVVADVRSARTFAARVTSPAGVYKHVFAGYYLLSELRTNILSLQAHRERLTMADMATTTHHHRTAPPPPSAAPPPSKAPPAKRAAANAAPPRRAPRRRAGSKTPTKTTGRRTRTHRADQDPRRPPRPTRPPPRRRPSRAATSPSVPASCHVGAVLEARDRVTHRRDRRRRER